MLLRKAMVAVVDVVNGKLMFLSESEREAVAQLQAAFPHVPDADLANTGFDIAPCDVTVELRPHDKQSLRFRKQRALFTSEEGEAP